VVTGPVRVVAYVDYDTGGWIIGHAFVKQLRNLGVSVSQVDFLIREECFTAEEKHLYAHPCSMSTPAYRTKTLGWLKEGGGLDGKPMGIHSNHVQPYERVRDLCLQLLSRATFER